MNRREPGEERSEIFQAFTDAPVRDHYSAYADHSGTVMRRRKIERTGEAEGGADGRAGELKFDVRVRSLAPASSGGGEVGGGRRGPRRAARRRSVFRRGSGAAELRREDTVRSDLR